VEEIGEREIELTCVDKKKEVDKEGIRRKKCDVPEDLEFKTKPQLALEMLHGVQKTVPSHLNMLSLTPFMAAALNSLRSSRIALEWSIF